MENKISDKIIEIERYLEELYEIFPISFEEYKIDFKSKAVSERYFERIIEAVVDLTFLMIKEKELKQPEYEKESFDILARAEIISETLSSRLQYAKGMRNILAHEYGKVDDQVVFNSINEELKEDILNFIKSINAIL